MSATDFKVRLGVGIAVMEDALAVLRLQLDAGPMEDGELARLVIELRRGAAMIEGLREIRIMPREAAVEG